MRPRSHTLILLPPRRRAFTLIELLIVIGIVGFILTISIVGFAPMFKRAGIDKAREMLRAGLESTRIQAIQQRRLIRFEARPVPDSTTHTWHFASNAGGASPEWRQLPDFVTIATNATAPGDAQDQDGDTVVGGGGAYPDIFNISLTFSPDGSLRRYAVNGGTPESPTSPFGLQVTDMRDTGSAPAKRWTVIYPLTGSMRSYPNLNTMP